MPVFSDTQNGRHHPAQRKGCPMNHQTPTPGMVKSAVKLACLLLLLPMLAIIPACGVSGTITDTPGTGSSTNPLPTDEESIALRLANLTDYAVNAQIFLSNNPEHATAETLFINTNSYTEGIGLAASGLLIPQGIDSVEVACTDGMIIGTQGGEFFEAETGELQGVGTIRILQHGLVFDCGDQITLIYREITDGQFTVELTLE